MTITEKLDLAASLCYTKISDTVTNLRIKKRNTFEITSDTLLANNLKLYYEIITGDEYFKGAVEIEKTDNGYLFKGIKFIIK